MLLPLGGLYCRVPSRSAIQSFVAWVLASVARLAMFDRLDYRMFDELGGVVFSYIILLSKPTLVVDRETERDRRDIEKEKEMKEEKTNPDAGLKTLWRAPACLCYFRRFLLSPGPPWSLPGTQILRVSHLPASRFRTDVLLGLTLPAPHSIRNLPCSFLVLPLVPCPVPVSSPRFLPPLSTRS